MRTLPDAHVHVFSGVSSLFSISMVLIIPAHQHANMCRCTQRRANSPIMLITHAHHSSSPISYWQHANVCRCTQRHVQPVCSSPVLILILVHSSSPTCQCVQIYSEACPAILLIARAHPDAHSFLLTNMPMCAGVLRGRRLHCPQSLLDQHQRKHAAVQRCGHPCGLW